MVLTGCDQGVCSKPHYIIFKFFLLTIDLFFDSETIPSYSKKRTGKSSLFFSIIKQTKLLKLLSMDDAS